MKRLCMTKERYERLFALVKTIPAGESLLHWINLICALIFYTVYPASLAILLIRQDVRLGSVLGIPAIAFVILSIIRKLINRPRPYEAFGLVPLLKKESNGCSFPSRHVFSAFMIAATVMTITPWGALLYFPAILMAAVRVIGGVHYPTDVIAGAIAAELAALFYLL